MLSFSDGIKIETSGPLRPLKLDDGWYVVGEGMLIPCKDTTEVRSTLKEMKKERRENGGL